MSPNFESVMQLDTKLSDMIEECKHQVMDEETTAKKEADIYIKIMEEICQKDSVYRPVLLRIKKGMKDM